MPSEKELNIVKSDISFMYSLDENTTVLKGQFGDQSTHYYEGPILVAAAEYGLYAHLWDHYMGFAINFDNHSSYHRVNVIRTKEGVSTTVEGSQRRHQLRSPEFLDEPHPVHGGTAIIFLNGDFAITSRPPELIDAMEREALEETWEAVAPEVRIRSQDLLKALSL